MEGPIINYLVTVVSTTAVVESVVTTVESTVVAVESVVTSVEAPPQAVNVAIATIANNFFIMYFYLYLNIQLNFAIPKFKTSLLFQP
jgi:hypothetical protein